jgi:hypothetical protein
MEYSSRLQFHHSEESRPDEESAWKFFSARLNQAICVSIV